GTRCAPARALAGPARIDQPDRLVGAGARRRAFNTAAVLLRRVGVAAAAVGFIRLGAGVELPGAARFGLGPDDCGHDVAAARRAASPYTRAEFCAAARPGRAALRRRLWVDVDDRGRRPASAGARRALGRARTALALWHCGGGRDGVADLARQAMVPEPLPSPTAACRIRRGGGS